MIPLYRIIILVLITLSFTACTSTPLNISAGNDEDSDIGLGGTGMLANNIKDDSGMGGTGILGQITGFGSIFVNGIEIEYDNKTPFTIDGNAAAPQQLEIGDVVEVLTLDTKQHTHALTINLRHEVIGKVESVEAKTYSFKVDGQTIILPINAGALPEVGSRVAVSGFRVNANTIMSSRVTPAGTRQSLLRTHTALPFMGKTEQWLIQMHVQNKVSFHLGGAIQTFTTREKTAKSDKHLRIKILQLQKSKSGQLELKEVIDPAALPLGRASITPGQWNNENRIQPKIQMDDLRQQQKTGPGSGSRQINNTNRINM